MSAHNESDFDRLLAAHANRDLEQGELEQLQVLARDDDERARELREVGVLHRAFDAERALFAVAAPPLEAREEADETYRRMSQSAARAEQTLRDLSRGASGGARLPPARSVARVLTMPRVLGAVAAAVVLFAAAFALGVFSPAQPEDLRLRAVPRIFLEKEISMASREISWYAVVGARSYDVVVTDEDNRTILARPGDAARSTTWELNPDEFTLLAEHSGPLYLRIVAFDGSGIELGTTGDRLLKIR